MPIGFPPDRVVRALASTRSLMETIAKSPDVESPGQTLTCVEYSLMDHPGEIPVSSGAKKEPR